MAPDYEITEICIQGKLTAEAGFALVSKAGVEGAVLHIAGPVSEALDGSTLDAVDTPEGPGIGITTPDSTPLTDDS